jgi:hypothetical protein
MGVPLPFSARQRIEVLPKSEHVSFGFKFVGQQRVVAEPVLIVGPLKLLIGQIESEPAHQCNTAR